MPRPRPRPCVGVAGSHCPNLTTSRRGRCDACQRAADRRRGTPAQRGYGEAHRQLRKQLEPIVAAGRATCARCGERIEPGQPWDLDHDDHDRRHYLGPSHAAHNRQTSLHRHEDARAGAAVAFFNTTPKSPDPLPRRQIRHTPPSF